MGLVVEKIEKSVATAKFEISKEAFDKGIETAYQKNKSKFNIDGFRRGKAPRSIIERRYGKNVFYEEALDISFPEAYVEAVKESDLSVIASPRLTAIDEIGENGAKLTIELALKPEFELPEYKGIKVESYDYSATEEDVTKEIEKLQDKNARLVTLEDGETKEGDTAVINFEGFVDDVAFEGGKGENYNLVLGSHSFIPGFEEQLVGKKKGEKVDVNVTFPEKYHQDTLAGKPAVFKCEVLEIKRKELPELDDEFAMDLGFDDLAALKKDTEEKLVKTKTAELKGKAQQKIINTLVEAVVMDIAPQHLFERKEQVKEGYEQRLRSSGIDPEMYYKYVLDMGEEKDPEMFEKQFNKQAEEEIKTELVLAKIIDVENIEASDEEVDAEIEKIAKNYNQTKEEFKEKMDENTENYLKGYVKQQKVIDFLLENADASK